MIQSYVHLFIVYNETTVRHYDMSRCCGVVWWLVLQRDHGQALRYVEMLWSGVMTRITTRPRSDTTICRDVVEWCDDSYYNETTVRHYDTSRCCGVVWWLVLQRDHGQTLRYFEMLWSGVMTRITTRPRSDTTILRDVVEWCDDSYYNETTVRHYDMSRCCGVVWWLVLQRDHGQTLRYFEMLWSGVMTRITTRPRSDTTILRDVVEWCDDSYYNETTVRHYDIRDVVEWCDDSYYNETTVRHYDTSRCCGVVWWLVLQRDHGQTLRYFEMLWSGVMTRITTRPRSDTTICRDVVEWCDDSYYNETTVRHYDMSRCCGVVWWLVLQRDHGQTLRYFEMLWSGVMTRITTRPRSDTTICRDVVEWCDDSYYNETTVRHYDMSRCCGVVWWLVLQRDHGQTLRYVEMLWSGVMTRITTRPRSDTTICRDVVEWCDDSYYNETTVRHYDTSRCCGVVWWLVLQRDHGQTLRYVEMLWSGVMTRITTRPRSDTTILRDVVEWCDDSYYNETTVRHYDMSRCCGVVWWLVLQRDHGQALRYVEMLWSGVMTRITTRPRSGTTICRDVVEWCDDSYYNETTVRHYDMSRCCGVVWWLVFTI